MRKLNWATDRAKWLVPISVVLCATLLAADLLAFWALGRRPLISTLEMNTLVWALLIGAAGTYTARWAILGEARSRMLLAGTLAVMVMVSALHPWHNGWGMDADTPQTTTPPQAETVLVFEPGVLTEGQQHDTW